MYLSDAARGKERLYRSRRDFTLQSPVKRTGAQRRHAEAYLLPARTTTSPPDLTQQRHELSISIRALTYLQDDVYRSGNAPLCAQNANNAWLAHLISLGPP